MKTHMHKAIEIKGQMALSGLYEKRQKLEAERDSNKSAAQDLMTANEKRAQELVQKLEALGVKGLEVKTICENGLGVEGAVKEKIPLEKLPTELRTLIKEIEETANQIDELTHEVELMLLKTEIESMSKSVKDFSTHKQERETKTQPTKKPGRSPFAMTWRNNNS